MIPGVRDLAVYSKKKNTKGELIDRIDIDENLLNIYMYDDEPIRDWQSSVQLQPYDEISKVYFDIETHSDDETDPKASLKPEKSRIILIGVMDENGKVGIIDCEKVGEAYGIMSFLNMLTRKRPQILTGFNIFEFDLPFILKRCEILGLSHPFKVSDRETMFETAKINNMSVCYKSIWLDYGKIAIIDVFYQALAWDNVFRKLTKYGLKHVPLQMGLVEEVPQELPYQEQRKAVKNWTSGGRELFYKYLESDLFLTKKLADFLIPDIYYQKQLLPEWNLQSLSTGGMGTKWNNIVTNEYKKNEHKLALKNKPTSDTTTSFEGGLVGSKAGLYRNVSKIDVASLYPSIMLRYGIHSYKDPKKLILAVLKGILTERLRLKKIGKDKKGTEEGRLAKQREGALKVLINSAYGFLGTKNKEFNDYVAAALVTAYGRAILKHMIKFCIESGAVPANWDTDGLYYATSDTSFETNKQVYNFIQSKLPEGIKIDYEVEALGYYVPPASDKDADEGEGLRKNYIIIFRDGSVKANGKYRKRNVCDLERSYMPGLVKAYVMEGEEGARTYHQNILTKLMTRSYSTEKLSVTRKISANEKRFVELGLGERGEVVTVYKSPDRDIIGKRGKPLKKGEVMWSLYEQDIDWMYYINIVRAMWQEFESCVKY